MPWTLSRYFFRRHVMTIVWFVLGVVSLIFLIDFNETSNQMSGLPGYTVSGGLLMTALRLPLILQQTVPFIVLFAGMTTLIALNRKYELVVTRAAGISVWQFMAPFVVASFLTGIVAVGVLNPLAAWGQRTALTVESKWQGKKPHAKNETPPWIRQIYEDDDAIIGAETVMDDGLQLSGVVVIHFSSDGRIILRQDAASAKLEDGYWLLKDVKESRPGEILVVKPEVKMPTNLKREFVRERLTSPETVAFYDLSNKIEAARSFGISTKALETQFHSLLSLPLLLVAMTLISATVTLRFSRFAQPTAVILGGIVSGFVLYVVTVLVKAFGSSGVVPPFIATWIPVFVALALGSTILLHQEDG
ncbi:LPS export ABC transporter permease LptG [Gellertiella hungarica]|uniref:Lipopolysaccharide export system permease protein n=1 Tax=Gellertiella hungarica TaxID=1572859 RepID=A0A7W6J682_9HYPH|nr:LPS export ABC transporter permease LptG [Gellertiella hungarica]MBB4065546.1 lipopolysaccharide export system permease protein [Gellertiella hungarica]